MVCIRRGGFDVGKITTSIASPRPRVVGQAMSAKEQLCGRSAEAADGEGKEWTGTPGPGPRWQVFWLLAFIMMATTCYASAGDPKSHFLIKHMP